MPFVVSLGLLLLAALSAGHIHVQGHPRGYPGVVPSGVLVVLYEVGSFEWTMIELGERLKKNRSARQTMSEAHVSRITRHTIVVLERQDFTWIDKIRETDPFRLLRLSMASTQEPLPLTIELLEHKSLKANEMGVEFLVLMADAEDLANPRVSTGLHRLASEGRPHPWVSDNVLRLLIQEDPMPVATIVPLLGRILIGLEYEVAYTIILNLLQGLEDKGWQGIPIFSEILAMDDPDLRIEAAGALADMAPETPEVIPILRDLLNDPDEDIRYEAQRGLDRAESP